VLDPPVFDPLVPAAPPVLAPPDPEAPVVVCAVVEDAPAPPLAAAVEVAPFPPAPPVPVDGPVVLDGRVGLSLLKHARFHAHVAIAIEQTRVVARLENGARMVGPPGSVRCRFDVRDADPFCRRTRINQVEDARVPCFVLLLPLAHAPPGSPW